jgi:hypothetical protein
MVKKNLIFLSIITVFVTVVLFATSFYSSISTAQTVQPTPDPATIEKATNDYLADICKDHGGINCSAINSDYPIVCNDGTVDESLISIFSVPQCQESINNLVNEQSDLMAETGCYPPSEITCISQESYNSTYQRLNSLGMANTELGRIELAECWKEVLDYQTKNNDYKLCLSENKIAPIDLPTDRLVLPILKAVFCPMFYGVNSTYEPYSDLCVCDEGYVKNNGTCLAESSICQLNYGTDSYAQGGNCIKPTLALINNPRQAPLQTNNTPLPSVTVSTSPTSSSNPPIQTFPSPPIVNEQYQNISEPPPPIIVPDISPQNIFKNIFSSIASGIKNIFRIFR